MRNHCAGFSGELWAAAENCTVSRLGTGHWSMFSLFLKESLTFHRPVSKWGGQKCCQARHDWKRLLSGAGKGFIWSIYCHGNSECDLEAVLALSQVERFGKKQILKQGLSRGESSCPGRAPKGMQRALRCAKAESNVPASWDEGGNPCHCSRWRCLMSMLGTC